MSPPNAIAWVTPDNADRVASVMDRAGITLTGVGTPERGQTTAIAERLGAEPLTDLRAALASADARVVLIAASPASIDARTLADADGRGLRVATIGPIARSLAEFTRVGLAREHAGARSADLLRLVPRPRRHPAFRAATEVIESFGRIGLAAIDASAPAGAGGMQTALFTAIDAAHTLIGTPELVDAATAAPRADHLAALLRFPDGRAAQLTASTSEPGGWRLTLHGEEGRVTIRQSGFDWFAPDGSRRDEHRTEPAQAAPDADLVRALIDLVDPGGQQGPATDWVALHSTADAAALSARTGQPESPATIARATMQSA